jgi:glycosyltransferase involved in cell wall biosynthesis
MTLTAPLPTAVGEGSKSALRILHVARSVEPRSGGTYEGARCLAHSQIAAGHTVETVTLDAPGLIHAMPGPVHLLGPGAGAYGRTTALDHWLMDHLRRFDVVVVHGLWQYHGFATRRACRRASVPYAVFPHGMLDPWFKHTYPLKHLKKWLYWPWGEYRVLRDAGAVLFTAEEERLAARTSFWLYRANEEVVGFGTEPPPDDAATQQAAFLARFPELAGRRLLLFLGRVHPKKGVDTLMRAFAAHGGDLHLVMAGPDPDGLRSALEAEAGKASARITWTGMLQGAEKWGVLRCADAFILPSHQENFGVAVVEALACGVPVLISRRVNIWREIDAAKAGWTAEDDQAGCDELVRRWASAGQAERAELASATRGCFARHFTMAGAAARLDTVLQRLCGKKR